MQDPSEFQQKLTSILVGVRYDEALAGLVSAILLLISSTTLEPDLQDAFLAKITETMAEKLATARIVLETGQLPH